MTAIATRHTTAFLDGPDSPDISNPIHSTAVAAEYGFRAALVGGVTFYGWCVPPILEVLGEQWLDGGWADVRFKRPVYPGDALLISFTESGQLTLAAARDESDVRLTGTAGLGLAPWFDELTFPNRITAEPRPDTLPWLTLEGADVGEDLRPMAVPYLREDARVYAEEKQRDTSALWVGPDARIHPGWIAARMTPLLKHSYDYGPSIHVRSQVQHLAPAHAGQVVTVAGRLVEVHERRGHHTALLDGTMRSESGEELARLRHTTIFRPAKKS